MTPLLFPSNSIRISGAAQCSTPVTSPPAGTYTGTQSVTISCSTPGSTIYYTTNGATPTTASAIYTAPLLLNTSQTVKALATAPSFAQSTVSSAVYTISGALSIRVSSGTLINGTGSIVQLRGADTFGMEGTYTNGGPSAWTYGGWQTTNNIPPFATLAAAYKWNCFRIPVHLHSVLGLTSYKFKGTDFTLSGGVYQLPISLAGVATVNCDPHGTYMAELKSVLDSVTAAGCYFIVDLHLWGPQVTVAGTTVPIWNSYQNPASWMPDIQAVAAWTKLAGLIKNYPNGIIDLVNEPTYPKWAEWANGAAHLTMDYNAQTPIPPSQYYIGPINASWSSAGMVQLLAAVRGAGAANVVLLNGVGYAGELGNSSWITGDATGATWLSTVAANISDSQICAGLHAYPNQPFSDPNYYRWYSGDNTPATNGYRQWLSLVPAIVAAGYPLIIGECGGQTQGSGTEPFCSDVLAQIDTLNTTKPGSVHVLGWSANPITAPQANFQLLWYPTGVPPVAPTTDWGTVYTGWTIPHA